MPGGKRKAVAPPEFEVCETTRIEASIERVPRAAERLHQWLRDLPGVGDLGDDALYLRLNYHRSMAEAYRAEADRRVARRRALCDHDWTRDYDDHSPRAHFTCSRCDAWR